MIQFRTCKMIKLRPDAAYDIENALKLINDPIYRCCFNCENVDLDNNKCKKWNATPPIKVVTFGCEAWIYNDIPF